MRIKHIALKHFRAHDGAEFPFQPGLNLITGPNGLGKTNILEAVHYLCLTKSFLTSSDRFALRNGSPYFQLIGEFESDTGRSLSVRIAFMPGEGKKLFVNGVHITPVSEFIGRIPVVVFSPDDYVITAGGPEERRRFVDTMVSQSSSVYLNDLIRYRRTLKQRNDILQKIKRHSAPSDTALLDSWSRELVEIGSRIYRTRYLFIEKFNLLLSEAFDRIGTIVESPSVTYQPLNNTGGSVELEEIRAAFTSKMERNTQRERERGITLVGPHRDDLHFELDGLPLRRYASQGQHRSFGLALKFAQYNYLLSETEETPLLLLDDVFDNLDENRIRVFLSLLREDAMGQSMITAARKDIFRNVLPDLGDRHILIRNAITP
jgi:DNA replication and repair protein RecF